MDIAAIDQSAVQQKATETLQRIFGFGSFGIRSWMSFKAQLAAQIR